MKSKILSVCICSIVITLLVLAVLFQNTSTKTIYEQSKEAMYLSLENLQKELEDVLQRYEAGLITIYSKHDLIHDLKYSEVTDNSVNKHYNTAYEIAREEFLQEDGIAAIYIYDARKTLVSKYLHAVTPAYVYPEDPLYDKDNNGEKLQSYLETSDTGILISSYYNDSRKRQIVRFALNIYHGSKQIGCIVCDVDSTVFLRIMERYVKKQNVIWLQPSGDIPVLSAGVMEQQYMEIWQKLADRISAGSGRADQKQQVSKGVLFCFPFRSYQIELYSYMPVSLLVDSQKILMRNLMITAVIALGFAVCFSTVTAHYLTEPLHELTGSMRKIREGDTKLRVQIKGTAEVEELGDTFNEMLDTMQEMIAREYQSKLLIHEMEYKALQAQINPHFLYNTLDTMSSIAEIQNCNTVSHLSQALSRIFRYSMDNGSSMSTVEKEIIHLNSYIYVMNVRMCNQIVYDFQIEPQTLKLTLPRLTIQPLVENAVKHGLKNAHTEKKISISANVHENTLTIRVKDSGTGFDPARLNEQLKAGKKGDANQSDSIGLYNINDRIKLLYGRKYGIYIESEIGAGTEVMVTLPAEKGDTEHEGITLQNTDRG